MVTTQGRQTMAPNESSPMRTKRPVTVWHLAATGRLEAGMHGSYLGERDGEAATSSLWHAHRVVMQVGQAATVKKKVNKMKNR